MPIQCPVCGEEAEHVRRERDRDEESDDEFSGPGTTLEVKELCASDDRWDRICHGATLRERDGAQAPVIVVYYHYFGDDDDSE